MNLVVASAFRNSGGRAMLYMERVAALRDALAGVYSVRVAAVEGDSTDNTRHALAVAARFHNLELDLVTCNHGGPVFGSTEEAARMVALSKVGNAIFESVRESDDVLVYVESDLLWNANDISALIALARAKQGGFDVLAPLVMAGDAFYDIWGFRWLDGTRWSPFEHRTLPATRWDTDPIEVSSVGSCLVMRAEVARACRIKNDYCLVGWCEDARAQGYRIGVVPAFEVRQL